MLHITKSEKTLTILFSQPHNLWSSHSDKMIAAVTPSLDLATTSERPPHTCHHPTTSRGCVRKKYCTRKKGRQFHVWPKNSTRRVQTLPPPRVSSLPILLIPLSSKINPLGIKWLTFLRHAHDFGFTVTQGKTATWHCNTRIGSLVITVLKNASLTA